MQYGGELQRGSGQRFAGAGGGQRRRRAGPALGAALGPQEEEDGARRSGMDHTYLLYSQEEYYC